MWYWQDINGIHLSFFPQGENPFDTFNTLDVYYFPGAPIMSGGTKEVLKIWFLLQKITGVDEGQTYLQWIKSGAGEHEKKGGKKSLARQRKAMSTGVRGLELSCGFQKVCLEDSIWWLRQLGRASVIMLRSLFIPRRINSYQRFLRLSFSPSVPDKLGAAWMIEWPRWGQGCRDHK